MLASETSIDVTAPDLSVEDLPLRDSTGLTWFEKLYETPMVKPAISPCPWYQAVNKTTGKCEIGGSLLYGLLIGGAVLIVALKR